MVRSETFINLLSSGITNCVRQAFPIVPPLEDFIVPRDSPLSIFVIPLYFMFRLTCRHPDHRTIYRWELCAPLFEFVVAAFYAEEGHCFGSWVSGDKYNSVNLFK